jgi:hypothetical protein
MYTDLPPVPARLGRPRGGRASAVAHGDIGIDVSRDSQPLDLSSPGAE